MTFCGKFFVSQYQKLRMGIFLFLRTFCYRKFFWKRWLGAVSRYSLRSFCHTLPKENVQESLSAPLISGVEKIFA